MTLDNSLLNTLRAFAYGHAYARSSDWLCTALNCTRRELQHSRRRLEREHPLLSANEGYWICDDPAQYSSVISTAIKNLVAERERIDDLKFCLWNTWPCQPMLFEIDEVA